MQDTKTTVLVTGISGNLGLRLLSQLSDFSVIGIDLKPPATDIPLRFWEMDFGEEESCHALTMLIREYRPSAVVHLAFVIDPIRTNVLDVQHMWRINVAGTARKGRAFARPTTFHRDDTEGGVGECAYIRITACRSIFPVPVFGNSPMNLISRGYL